MNTFENAIETTFSSNVSNTLRSYKRIYRGFPVLNFSTTSSEPSQRTITYRGVRGVISNIKSERNLFSHQIIYRGFPLNALAA